MDEYSAHQEMYRRFRRGQLLRGVAGPALTLLSLASLIMSRFFASTLLILLSAAFFVSALAVGTLTFVYGMRQTRAPERQLWERTIDPITDTDVEQAFADTTADSAELLIDMLLAPRAYYPRITEIVSKYYRSNRTETQITINLPACADTRRLALPLILQTKGVIDNRMRLMTFEENEISMLNGKEMTIWIAACIRRLVETKCKRSYGRFQRVVEPTLWNLIDADRKLNDSDIRQLEEMLRSTLTSASSAASTASEVVSRICELLQVLSHSYPVGFEYYYDEDKGHPCDGSSRRLRYVLVRRTVQKPERSSGRVARIQRLLGIYPPTIVVNLDNAERCQSYHVEARGPEGTYVARQSLSYQAQDGTLVPVHAARLGTKHRVGQRMGHLFVRRGEGFRGVKFRCDFYERTPGSIARAAVSATAAFAIILAYSVGQMEFLPIIGGFLENGWVLPSHVFLFESYRPNYELLTVLLAAPIVVSAWLSFDTTKPFSGGSIIARISSLVTIVTSFSALATATYGVIQSNDRLLWIYWSAIVTVALVNSIWSLGTWLHRSRLEGILYEMEDVWLDYD